MRMTMTMKQHKITKKSTKKEQHRMIVMVFAVLLLSTTILTSLPSVEAAKIRACSTNNSPKGVEAASSTEVWLANDGGTLQKFTTLSTNCTGVTPYSVFPDPHFIDRSSSTKIAYTSHVNDTINYYDPSAGTIQKCASTNIDGPDDIDSYDSNTQFSTSYNKGKIIKTVKGASSCTITSYTIPGTSANPEGIDKSTDISGFFFVDQNNKKLYKITASTGAINLVRDLSLDTSYKPWFVADSTDTGNFVWVTFRDSGVLRAYATISGALVETSPSLGTGLNVYDIAVINNGIPVVTWIFDPKISKYDYNTNLWTTHDWNTDCSGCDGFGIDTIYSTNTYYAALRSLSGTSKIVTGSF
jgi:hypothetical protein